MIFLKNFGLRPCFEDKRRPGWFAKSVASEGFEFLQREGIAAAQEEAGDLLAKLALERGVGLREFHRHVAPGKPHERGQFGPSLITEINIHLCWVGQQGAGD